MKFHTNNLSFLNPFLQMETLKQDLSNSLTHAQQDHQTSIERLTSEHEQIIVNLKSEYSKEKSTIESKFLSIIHEKYLPDSPWRILCCPFWTQALQFRFLIS